ncbi:SPASM domain-containing protein [Coriobacteriales bacterium OH1046]|nr:SPASM domain-containing protein [Coriobacteriales bacterium OH1046]
MANGDIGACLGIERRLETIQGNIRHERLRAVWEHRFELFRRDLSDSRTECRACEHVRFCRGDAHHGWDYDAMRPTVCLKGTLF